MDWHSIHVYYYDSDKDALILDGVRPLFHRLAGHVSGAFFTRHWRQGPHLRLNVRTDAHTFDTVVVPAAEEIIGGFLARHPSTRPLDPETELAAHQRLAELEHETGPLTPWYPDNSLHGMPYDWREEVLGNRETAALLADFYASTTELAFQTIERGNTSSRLATGFDMMIASAHALSGRDITKSFISFRSHAEGFLHGFPEAAGLRPVWEEHYRRNSDALVRRVRAVLSTVDTQVESVPVVRDWLALAEPLRRRGAQLMTGGTFTLPVFESLPEGMDWDDISPFHGRLLRNPKWPDTQRSTDFVLYRLMINLLYLNLTRLGVTPVQRFLLCHLAANAVEETFGISAFDLVG